VANGAKLMTIFGTILKNILIRKPACPYRKPGNWVPGWRIYKVIFKKVSLNKNLWRVGGILFLTQTGQSGYNELNLYVWKISSNQFYSSRHYFLCFGAIANILARTLLKDLKSRDILGINFFNHGHNSGLGFAVVLLFQPQSWPSAWLC